MGASMIYIHPNFWPAQEEDDIFSYSISRRVRNNKSTSKLKSFSSSCSNDSYSFSMSVGKSLSWGEDSW